MEGRRVIRYVTTFEETSILDKEIARLRRTYGISVTRPMVLSALIKMHGARMQMIAKEEPASLIARSWARTYDE
jgi:hypothetical protein